MTLPKKRKKKFFTRHRPRVFLTLSPEEIGKLDELVHRERTSTKAEEGSRSSVVGRLIEEKWNERESTTSNQ